MKELKELQSFPKESVTIEHKSRYSSHIGNTICAFLNTIGGTIYMGIDEKDNSSSAFEDIINKVKNLINSEISPTPQKIDFDKTNWMGKEIIVINVHPKTNNDIFSFKGVSYYREGNQNRILTTNVDNPFEQIIVPKRRKAKNLPILEEYSPSKEEKRKVFDKEKEQHNVSYKKIGVSLKNNSTFYKYLDLDTVLMIFRIVPNDKDNKDNKNNKSFLTMRFVEPTKWDDQFESRFYNAIYKKVNKDPNNIPKLYASCFTPQDESEPAWQAYNKDKDGIGKRCVQLCINQIALRNELVKNLNNTKACTIVEGSVQYKSKEFIRTLHLSTDKESNPSDIYKDYFSDFTLASYINLLLLKRMAFEHEREVRIFLIYEEDKLKRKSKKKEKSGHKDIRLDWLSILEGIKVNPDCTQTEINLLQDEIDNLIDKSSVSDKEKLKEKLKVQKYDVNEDEDRNNPIKIGETYKKYMERLNKRKERKEKKKNNKNGKS